MGYVLPGYWIYGYAEYELPLPTYQVVYPRVDVRPLVDGLASIYNAEQEDSRTAFEVVRVAVRPSSGQGPLSGASPMAAKLSLYRTTAQAGGEAVLPIKRDTGGADLPAGVECSIFPTSVTPTGAALRSLADAPSLVFAGSNQWTSARVYGGSLYAYQRGCQADILRQVGDASVERIVLRPGEGLALVLDSHGWPRAGQINMSVRNEATGATYQFRSRGIGHPGCAGEALIALYNGSASGVLGVAVAEYPNDGEHNFPVFRLARIEQAIGGDVVVPFAADTANVPPAELQCRGGDFATKLFGEGSGVPIDWSTQHGASMTVAAQQKCGQFRGITGVDPFVNVGLTPGFQRGQVETVLYQAPAGSGILLRPGEGFALLAGRAGALETSTFAYMDVEMTVLHYVPIQAGMPSEDDVRDGEVFGPSGEFEGDLVLPVPADVRLGVGYGSDGTEFTGTLDGGGPGGTSTFLSRRSR